MRSSWSGLVERARELASLVDVSRVSVSDAEVLVRELAALESVVAVVKAQAAARVAESGRWRLAGARSPEDHLARQTGMSPSAARSLLATGSRLQDLPEVRAAAVGGALSPAQTALVADAAAAALAAGAPDTAGELVERAARESLAGLGRACEEVKARADGDPAATRARVHRERGVRRYTRDGVGHLHMSGPVEAIAEVELAYAPFRERIFAQARRDGRRETPQAYDFDAMLALARAARGASAPGGAATDETVPPSGRRSARRWGQAKVIVRVDYEALLRGRPVGGEVCEIAGLGPLPVAAVEEIQAEGGFLAAVLTKAQQVVGVAHLGRKFTARQQTALEWTNPVCAAEGCGRHARLELDHRTPWAQSRVTRSDDGDRLCDADHDLRTHHGWALVDGHGTRPFVPRDDPRHPRHDRSGHGGTDPPLESTG